MRDRLAKLSIPYWPGRSLGFRTLPVTLAPAPVDTVPAPLPLAGGFRTTVSASAAQIDTDTAHSAGRGFLSRTADDLDSGPIPERINRGTRALNAGKIGNGAGPSGISGWPYDGNELLVPHTAIPRTPITVSPFSRTIDTGVTIPSIMIGGPV